MICKRISCSSSWAAAPRSIRCDSIRFDCASLGTGYDAMWRGVAMVLVLVSALSLQGCTKLSYVLPQPSLVFFGFLLALLLTERD